MWWRLVPNRVSTDVLRPEICRVVRLVEEEVSVVGKALKIFLGFERGSDGCR